MRSSAEASSLLIEGMDVSLVGTTTKHFPPSEANTRQGRQRALTTFTPPEVRFRPTSSMNVSFAACCAMLETKFPSEYMHSTRLPSEAFIHTTG